MEVVLGNSRLWEALVRSAGNGWMGRRIMGGGVRTRVMGRGDGRIPGWRRKME